MLCTRRTVDDRISIAIQRQQLAEGVLELGNVFSRQIALP